MACPNVLSVLRAEARADKIDRSAYATVTTLAELQRWVDEAFEAGVVAFDTETTSLDPIQAEIVGFSLCVAPGAPATCRSAIAAGQGDLFGGGELVPGQLGEDEVLAVLKPLMEAPGVLKVAQNVKFDWHILAQRGIETAPIDDTMLLSYALDAGATNEGHGMDALAQRWLGHETIQFGERRRHRQELHRLRPGRDRGRDRICRRGRRRDAAALARAEAAARRRRR